MQLEEITIRLAGTQDLDELNRVVEQAVMSWRLPDRVKRLALPSYRYSEFDMRHMEILVAVGPDKSLVGLAAWELSDKQKAFDDKTAILLHGIFVLPKHQRHGIGSHLLRMVEETALKRPRRYPGKSAVRRGRLLSRQGL
jgi:GNAT superfamily N-acetyltransferase